jgi:hypothetical protein
MPLTTGDQFAEALRQLNTNSSETVRNVQGLGRVAVTKQITQTQRVAETITENTVEKPVAPPKPPETPNTAPSVVNFSPNGTLTAGSLAVGQVVGTASCIDIAPTGSQNTCTYNGGDADFAIGSGGQIALRVSTLPAGTYTFPIVATDAGGLIKADTLTVTVVAAAYNIPSIIVNTTNFN